MEPRGLYNEGEEGAMQTNGKNRVKSNEGKKESVEREREASERARGTRKVRSVKMS